MCTIVIAYCMCYNKYCQSALCEIPPLFLYLKDLVLVSAHHFDLPNKVWINVEALVLGWSRCWAWDWNLFINSFGGRLGFGGGFSVQEKKPVKTEFKLCIEEVYWGVPVLSSGLSWDASWSAVATPTKDMGRRLRVGAERNENTDTIYYTSHYLRLSGMALILPCVCACILLCFSLLIPPYSSDITKAHITMECCISVFFFYVYEYRRIGWSGAHRY